MSDVKKETTKGGGLPKFDSTPWLCLGAALSFLLTGLDIWALVAQWHIQFILYQLSKLLSGLIGIVLGIHCLDMIGYYRKHGRLKKQ